MKIFIDKYSKFLFKLFLMGLILLMVYFLIPKYQIINNSGSVFKLNKLTGQVIREYTPSKAPKGYGD